MRNPFEIVSWFEEAVAEYAGAPYGIATDSCTDAIYLACKYLGIKNQKITIPKQTYVSVPQSIVQAGGELEFEDLDWEGIYQLKPTSIYDSAKRLTSNMYIPGSYMCLSFHHKKHLKIGKGGMILTDDAQAVDRIKKLRYDMYMTPEQAARGLTLLMDHPKNCDDLIENPPYRDLTTFEIFKKIK